MKVFFCKTQNQENKHTHESKRAHIFIGAPAKNNDEQNLSFECINKKVRLFIRSKCENSDS